MYVGLHAFALCQAPDGIKATACTLELEMASLPLVVWLPRCLGVSGPGVGGWPLCGHTRSPGSQRRSDVQFIVTGEEWLTLKMQEWGGCHCGTEVWKLCTSCGRIPSEGMGSWSPAFPHENILDEAKEMIFPWAFPVSI